MLKLVCSCQNRSWYLRFYIFKNKTVVDTSAAALYQTPEAWYLSFFNPLQYIFQLFILLLLSTTYQYSIETISCMHVK